ncbi:FAD-dependent monooxygenase, partial [Streptosporangium sandarakinum]
MPGASPGGVRRGRGRPGAARRRAGGAGAGARGTLRVLSRPRRPSIRTAAPLPPGPVRPARPYGRAVPAHPRILSRFTFKARQAERYRIGRIMVAGDAAHLF